MEVFFSMYFFKEYIWEEEWEEMMVKIGKYVVFEIENICI